MESAKILKADVGPNYRTVFLPGEILEGKWGRWAFWGVLALQLLPVWLFRYFPSQDSPMHLYNCMLLKEMLLSQPSLAHSYFALNPAVSPNALGHILLTGLLFVASPLIADKLFVTFYAITLGLSVRYALRSIRPESVFLSFLFLPIVFNFTVHMGFYNFCSAFALFFWTLGYWWRNASTLNWHKTGILAAAFLTMYTAHLMVLVFTLIVVCILALEAVFRSGSGKFWQVPQFKSFYAFVPATALAGLYLLRHHSDTALEPPFHSLRELLWDNFIISYGVKEGFIAGLFFSFLAIVTVWQIWQLVKERPRWYTGGLFLVLVLFIAIYFVIPNNMFGGGFARVRVLLFVVFVDLFWLTQFSYPRTLVRLTQFASISMALGLLVLDASAYSRLNPYLEEYVSAGSVIARDTSMLELSYSERGRTPDGQRLSWRVSPFRHAGAYIGIDRRLALVDNYEAKTGYFPLVYKQGLNPYDWTDALDDAPCIDLDGYVSASHRPINYIVVWFPDAQDPENPCVLRVLKHLQLNYRLIYKSPRNLVHVHQLQTDPETYFRSNK